MTATRLRARGATLGLVILVLAIGLAWWWWWWTGRDGRDGAELAPDEGIVEWVFDGDTINVTFSGGDERVRLLGINTPEIAHAPEPAECFGDAAKDETARLLPLGTRVRLERDQVARDHYGRLLAYVYRADDGLFVNLELVRTGYARPLTIEPNGVLRQELVDAARAAEAADLGLWAAC